jgi:hypothetical protein
MIGAPGGFMAFLKSKAPEPVKRRFPKFFKYHVIASVQVNEDGSYNVSTGHITFQEGAVMEVVKDGEPVWTRSGDWIRCEGSIRKKENSNEA